MPLVYIRSVFNCENHGTFLKHLYSQIFCGTSSADAEAWVPSDSQGEAVLWIGGAQNGHIKLLFRGLQTGVTATSRNNSPTTSFTSPKPKKNNN